MSAPTAAQAMATAAARLRAAGVPDPARDARILLAHAASVDAARVTLIAPEEIAPEIAERFDDVSILFADLVDFTRLAGEMRPVELVGLLNEIVSEFDGLVERHGLEKIKTIGDAYMAVGGLPNPSEDHPSAIANLAIDMQDAITKFGKNRNLHLGLRIGINTGPVIAGTIGRMKYAYDLWGDAVYVASRMESAGDTGKIHVNENTYLRIKDSYDFIARGEIPIKGKGLLSTYWLDCPACQDS